MTVHAALAEAPANTRMPDGCWDKRWATVWIAGSSTSGARTPTSCAARSIRLAARRPPTSERLGSSKQAPKPFPDEVLRQIKDLYQKALAADENSGRRPIVDAGWPKWKVVWHLCREMVREKVRSEVAFLGDGGGSVVDGERDSVSGHSRQSRSRVHIQPCSRRCFPWRSSSTSRYLPHSPLSIDARIVYPRGRPIRPWREVLSLSFVRTHENQAGIEMAAGNEKPSPVH